jgi:hypothetical protein
MLGIGSVRPKIVAFKLVSPDTRALCVRKSGLESLTLAKKYQNGFLGHGCMGLAQSVCSEITSVISLHTLCVKLRPPHPN